ncbi:MAG TPA: Slp family lipoprotein [Nitrospirota bacterium]
MNRIALLLCSLLLCQGCTYAISPTLADKAERNVAFGSLLNDPDAFGGKLLILGGTIDQITNEKQGTLIEVVQKQLDYWGKPQRTQKAGGRFLAFYPGFLDPMVYAPGRDITVAGVVQGTTSPMLENRQFNYPVLLMKEIRLWERGQPSWDKPSWLDPLYDPDSPGRRGY